jgi:hypothetical protein
MNNFHSENKKNQQNQSSHKNEKQSSQTRKKSCTQNKEAKIQRLWRTRKKDPSQLSNCTIFLFLIWELRQNKERSKAWKLS